MEPIVPTLPPETPDTPQPVVSSVAPGRMSGFLFGPARKFGLLRKLPLRTIGLTLLIVVVTANLGLSGWLLLQRSRALTPITMQGDNGKSALTVNSETGSVGVGSNAPNGLQSEAILDEKARGTANIRSGLLNKEPYMIYEDTSGKQWKLGVSGGELQFGTVGGAMKTFASLQQANSAGGSVGPVTVQGATASLAMNFSVDNSTLYVDASHNTVGIGTTDTKGHKLFVAGTVYATGSIMSEQRIITGGGTAGSPSLSFTNAGSSGIYHPGNGAVSTAVNGGEVLRVESGVVSTMSGANLQVSGYVRAGTEANSPSWKVARITGTLDGVGEAVASHGIANGNTRILNVTGYYRGGAGEARPLAIDNISATSIELVGGTAGRPYRLTIIYAADAAGW